MPENKPKESNPSSSREPGQERVNFTTTELTRGNHLIRPSWKELFEMPVRCSKVMGLTLCTAIILTACAPNGARLEVQRQASSSLCALSDAQGRLAIASIPVRADGNQPVLMRAVTPKKADNIRIENFGIVPDAEDGFRGIQHPSGMQISANREVQPHAQATIQLIVALDDATQPGEIESVALEYGDSGRNGTKTVTAGLRAQVFPSGTGEPAGSACTLSEQ